MFREAFTCLIYINMYYVFVGCVQDMSDDSFGIRQTWFARNTDGIS
jgi:hypothetical protein